MATKRTEAGRFDHGAQFFRAKGTAFAGAIADWCASGVAAPWGNEGRFVGVPGMTAPVHDLLDGLDVASETTVARIVRDSAGWRVVDAAGVEAGPFAAVAVTFPAPQASALLAASGLALAGPERASYAPCWSLMLRLAAEPGVALMLRPEDGPIALVTREGSKPAREGHGLVAHATPDWSRAHLEEAREAVQAALLGHLAALLGGPVAATFATVHRWRYAMVETALDVPCLYDPAQALGAAGDWCLGPRIEAAFDSGRALAGRIAADLGVTP